MRTAIPLCTLFVLSASAPSWAEETTEYLLLPMKLDVSTSTKADVIEPPHAVSFKADDCGITATVGATSEYHVGASSEHYGGTAYSSELKVEGSGQISGFVMSHAIKVGSHLSNFIAMEDGQTCTEKIDEKYQVFKKYSAVLRE